MDLLEQLKDAFERRRVLDEEIKSLKEKIAAAVIEASNKKPRKAREQKTA